MTEKHFYDRDFETGAPPEDHRGRSPRKSGGVLEFLVIILVAFALVFGFVRPFVVEAFYIPSESMVPTLEVGDRVFVNKFIYRFSEPQRGDIVVFRDVEGGEEDLIKRVIGLPGETVAIYNGEIYINNRHLEEPYINNESLNNSFSENGELAATTIPQGKVFMMGDNRDNSRDSRFFGPIPLQNIEGEAFVIFWPPTHIGLL